MKWKLDETICACPDPAVPVNYYESARNHQRNDGNSRSARQWFKLPFHCWEIVGHEYAVLSGMQGG